MRNRPIFGKFWQDFLFLCVFITFILVPPLYGCAFLFAFSSYCFTKSVFWLLAVRKCFREEKDEGNEANLMLFAKDSVSIARMSVALFIAATGFSACLAAGVIQANEAIMILKTLLFGWSAWMLLMIMNAEKSYGKDIKPIGG